KQHISLKTVVAIPIPPALFVILAPFLLIPTPFPNTNIQTSYPFLPLISPIFPPFPPLITPLLPHPIKHFTTYPTPSSTSLISSPIIPSLYPSIPLKLNL
ncbi:ECF transporter S component, partial [Staphylococcus aureus]|uniref:ECF transporter S component n=1 Tax=Staphylococcus aureus TaxID=1280 RepID=UPI001642ED10